MIERKEMEIKDFIDMLDANPDIYPGWNLLSGKQKEYFAWVRRSAGKAYSYFDDGKLVGVGGITYVGIGEGWFLTTPDVRKDKKFSLFREAKKTFDEIRKSACLWRIFATSKISSNFLKHLKFKKEDDVLIYTQAVQYEETV